MDRPPDIRGDLVPAAKTLGSGRAARPVGVGASAGDAAASSVRLHDDAPAATSSGSRVTVLATQFDVRGLDAAICRGVAMELAELDDVLAARSRRGGRGRRKLRIDHAEEARRRRGAWRLLPILRRAMAVDMESGGTPTGPSASRGVVWLRGRNGRGGIDSSGHRRVGRGAGGPPGGDPSGPCRPPAPRRSRWRKAAGDLRVRTC